MVRPATELNKTVTRACYAFSRGCVMRVCGLSLILILGACSPSPVENAQDDKNASSEVTSSAVSMPAQSSKTVDPFILRAGAWTTDFGLIVPNANLPADVLAEMNDGLPTGFDYCLPADTRSPDAEFFSGSPNRGCTYENVSLDEGRVSGAMRCDSPDLKIRIEFAGTYGAESYQMVSHVTLSDGTKQATAAMPQQGRRVGDC